LANTTKEPENVPLDQPATPSDAETAEGPPKRVSLFSIAVVFFWMGALSFGGGMTGWVYRTVVLKHAWVTNAQFIQAMTVAQTLPGGNVANLTAYIGNQLRGIPGALVGLFFLLLTPAVSVVVLFIFYQQIAQYPIVGVALEGVAAGAVGLLILMAWKTSAELKGNVVGLVFLAATFIGVGVLKLNLLIVVLCLAPFSVALAWPRSTTNEE
jgi:chromate transporter